MSIKCTIGEGTQLSGVTGYRLAAVLNQGGKYKSALQIVTEQNVVYDKTFGLGRGEPHANVTAGNLPTVGNALYDLSLRRPLAGGVAHDVSLKKFYLASIDRRIVGEWGYTFLQFLSNSAGERCDWSVTPNMLRGDEELESLSSGMLSFNENAGFKSLMDIDSSGKVLSWRAMRSATSDPLALMNSAAMRQTWTLNVYYKWNPNIKQPQNVPNDSPAAMIFEEVCGRFIDRRRFTADDLKVAFTAGGLNPDTLLTCNLDDVIPLPRRQEKMAEYQIGQDVQERVYVVYTRDINFPVW